MEPDMKETFSSCGADAPYDVMESPDQIAFGDAPLAPVIRTFSAVAGIYDDSSEYDAFAQPAAAPAQTLKVQTRRKSKTVEPGDIVGAYDDDRPADTLAAEVSAEEHAGNEITAEELARRLELQQEKLRGKVCVLTIDGGGMRGCIPARLLARLEELLQQKSGHPSSRLADYFDVVAGTSVGGLLTTMLLTPGPDGRPKFTAREAADFLVKYGSVIFPQRKPDTWHMLRSVLRPKYGCRKYEKTLRENLCHADGTPIELKELLRPCVIPAYDMGQARPLLFLSQVAKSNPSLNFCLADGAEIREKLMLSLGTGEQTQTWSFTDVARWGQLAWVTPIIDIMFNGSSSVTDFIVAGLSRFLGNTKDYLRIQVKRLPGTTKAMDNSSSKNIQQLFALADEVLQEKALCINDVGGHEQLDETNDERLQWYADQLIQEHRARLFRPHTKHVSAFHRSRARKEEAEKTPAAVRWGRLKALTLKPRSILGAFSA
eukprot:jgi/Mesen1/8605/ME000050S08018